MKPSPDVEGYRYCFSIASSQTTILGDNVLCQDGNLHVDHGEAKLVAPELVGDGELKLEVGSLHDDGNAKLGQKEIDKVSEVIGSYKL